MITTNKSKLTACAKFKEMIESDRMTINSKSLISELKNFVAIGLNRYEAKIGETDDLVMSSLLAVRMILQLQDYHKELTTTLNDFAGEDFIKPLPFIAMF